MKKRIIILIIFILLCTAICYYYNSNEDLKEAIKNENTKDGKDIFKLLVVDSQLGEPYHSARESMLKTLESFGYVKGKNLEVTYFSIGNNLKKGEDILRKNLKNNYNVIFTNGTIMTMAAKNVAFRKMEYKFVFACVTDPVGLGVVDNFIFAPKYNFTGVSYPVPVKSRLEFVKELIPNLKTIGLIYADMPQSQSYRRWIEDLLIGDPDFKEIKCLFRAVPFVSGENGSKIMAEKAKKYIIELAPKIDVFLSPNDQMGVQKYFANVVYKTANKPLVGIGRRDVMEKWGAAVSIFPSHKGIGKQAARMIKKMFEGGKIKDIFSEWPKNYGVAFDLNKTEHFGIKVSEGFIGLAKDNIIK